LLALSLGWAAAAHYSVRFVDIGPNHLKRIIEPRRSYQIFGRVADWPDLKERYTEIKVEVDSLRLPGEPSWRAPRVDGAVLLKISDTTTTLQRGDRIAVAARIYPIESRPNQRGFDYGRYLNLRGVHGVVYLTTPLSVQIGHRGSVGYVAVVDHIRAAIRGSLSRNLGPESAALAAGLLIGETRDIPAEIYAMFRDSGTLHVLAVSGSNVALIVLFAAFLLRPFGLRPTVRSVILVLLVVIFAGLAYADPSVMRAAIMATLVVLAGQVHRPYDLNNVIAATALVILIFEPSQLFDVGFQLSFVTAWGLIFMVPPVLGLFERKERRWYRWVAFPLVVCLVAQVCSTPLIACHFGRVPLVSVLANLAIVPLVALAVLGILLLLAADLLLPLLGAFVGSLLDLWLKGVIEVLRLFGGQHMPVLQIGGRLQSTWGFALVVSVYLILVLGVLAIRHRWARRLGLLAALTVLTGGLLTAVLVGGGGPGTKIEMHAIPGGIAVLAGSPDDESRDLVVTNLTGKDYPTDERILGRLLERSGRNALSRLYVLDADFDALADLVNLARAQSAAEIYVHHSLRPSWTDLVLREGDTALARRTGFFGGEARSLESPGVRLSEQGITWRFSSGEIVFANDASAVGPPGAISLERRVLVLGRPWAADADDWVGWRESGFETIVCARIEQPRDEWPDPELGPDQAPPDFVLDLSRLGAYTIELPL